MVAIGVILVAAALVTMAFMDTELRLTLFGFTQIQQGGSSFAGAGAGSQTSAALLRQTAYIRVVQYLVGASGLAVIILGSTLQPRVKEKKEPDVQTSSQIPPWERSDIPSAKKKESSP